jgi:CHAD domain-containing protein
MEADYIKLKAIKPFLVGYIREAMTMISSYPYPNDKEVHDVRVLMKKSRAVMRLIENQIEKDSFNRNYNAFRDVGRLMCTYRDTSVFRKTLRQLKKSNQRIFTALKENETIQKLMEKADPSVDPRTQQTIDAEGITEILKKAGFRLRFESLSNLDPGKLLKELEKTYLIAVEKYLICRNNMKPLRIHEFRIKAKDFLYQLNFFRPLNTSYVKSLEKKLDFMTQNLGKYNDLTQLIKAIGYKYSATGRSPALDELIILIREEQDKYLSRVWPIAHKIFCPGQPLANLIGFKILLI